MVSRGYEARPAPIVTPHPSKKDAKNEPSRAPTRTTGSITNVSIDLECETDKKKRTQRIVDTEVETTINNDPDDRRHKATVKAGNTIRGQCLFININQAIELASPSSLR